MADKEELSKVSVFIQKMNLNMLKIDTQVDILVLSLKRNEANVTNLFYHLFQPTSVVQTSNFQNICGTNKTSLKKGRN